MARLVYACRFEVATTDGLTTVLDAYRNWIEHHYKDRRGLDTFTINFDGSPVANALPAGHRVVTGRFRNDTGDVFRLEWAFPAENDDGLSWRNEVRIGAFENRCSVEHRIWIDSIVYRIAPFHLVLGSPSIIRDLCSRSTVHVGDMQIRATPYRLEVNGVPDFLTLLRSPLRQLPIVFISTFSGGGPNLIPDQDMARRLAGVGVVVTAKNADVTWELADTLGRTLSCYNGAARIYWPGFNETDDPRNHPLYLGNRIELLGPQAVARAIERSIFAVAAFRFVADARISSVIQYVQEAQRTARVEAERAIGGKDWEAYAFEIDAELSQAKEIVAELRAENENLKANQQIFLSGSASSVESAEEVASDEIEVPESVLAAVTEAGSKCTNLIILESAYDSAAKSPFQRPADIADALRDLDHIASDWTRVWTHNLIQ